VISPELTADPSVASQLADFSSQEEQAELKGYSESVRFLRITPKELAAKRAN